MSSTTAAVSPVEASKRTAAYRAVQDHLQDSARRVGIGSGSTVVYVVEAIAAKGPDVTARMTFYPTGDQSTALIEGAGLTLGSISALAKGEFLDVCFDGADEVDEDLNLIKGGGACLFQEKIVATASKKFVCVADYRKLSDRLGASWKQGIPIEVLPLAAKRVLHELELLGSQGPTIRQGGSQKAGPVVTDNSMWLIDAPFAPLLIPQDIQKGIVPPEGGNGQHGRWLVDTLAARLIQIPGIVEIGLFSGKMQLEGGSQRPVAAYFGMENGTVQVRGN